MSDNMRRILINQYRHVVSEAAMWKKAEIMEHFMSIEPTSNMAKQAWQSLHRYEVFEP